jgi:hypothetical protein
VDALARVAGELGPLQLGQGLKVESVVGGWQVFSVTFDPRHASRTQVVHAIHAGGATILPGPPTPTAGSGDGQ